MSFEEAGNYLEIRHLTSWNETDGLWINRKAIYLMDIALEEPAAAAAVVVDSGPDHAVYVVEVSVVRVISDALASFVVDRPVFAVAVYVA